MGPCTGHRIWLVLIAFLQWHGHVWTSWLLKEPVSSLPDEIDHVLAVCQESNMFLNCRNRYNRLVIKDTFYGRDNNHTCLSKIFDSDKLCNDPTPDSVKKKIDLMCSGEHKCKVPVSPAFLEAKGNYICPGVRKYLKVTYACHQHPKLHMVCNNCDNKCWPLCSKQCCEPPPVIPPTEAPVKEAPKKSTCQEGCPNHCAPDCQMACCASNILGALPEKKKTNEIIRSSCKGDCPNLCAPLCLTACCSRHKKSAAGNSVSQRPTKKIKYQLPMKQIAPLTSTCPASCPINCRPLCRPACCRVTQSNHPHPDYVEPLSARLQQLQQNNIEQCAAGCHPTCAPVCSPQCCAYMGELRALATPGPAPPPAQMQTPIQSIILPQAASQVQAPFPPPAQLLAQAPPPAQAMAQSPIVSQFATAVSSVTNPQARAAYAGYQGPQAFFNSQAAPYTAVNQPPASLVTSQTLDIEEPNHAYQQVNPVARGCPATCATTCDANCKLECCANPSSYIFTTNSVGDDAQRRTYERLLEKYRSEQLARYYQNRGFAG